MISRPRKKGPQHAQLLLTGASRSFLGAIFETAFSSTIIGALRLLFLAGLGFRARRVASQLPRKLLYQVWSSPPALDQDLFGIHSVAIHVPHITAIGCDGDSFKLDSGKETPASGVCENPGIQLPVRLPSRPTGPAAAEASPPSENLLDSRWSTPLLFMNRST